MFGDDLGDKEIETLSRRISIYSGYGSQRVKMIVQHKVAVGALGKMGATVPAVGVRDYPQKGGIASCAERVITLTRI